MNTALFAKGLHSLWDGGTTTKWMFMQFLEEQHQSKFFFSSGSGSGSIYSLSLEAFCGLYWQSNRLLSSDPPYLL